MPMEHVSHASRVMTWSTEFVNSLHSTTPSLPTSDALLGTGTTRSASSVPTTGSSMLTKFVSPFPTNAKLMMLPVSALLATKDTTWLMEHVSSPHSTMPSLQTQDAKLGTGIIKSAWSAQTDGFSTPTRYVSPSMTTAHPTTVPPELVPHASLDTFFQTELATWLTLFVNHQLRVELVLLATLDTLT